MFAVALMSTSCCKDDPVVPTGQMTLSELEGTWISTQYELNGDLYTACNALETSTDSEVADGDLMLIMVNFSTSNTDLSDNCAGLETNGMDLDYDKDAGKIILKSGGIFVYKFDVISYDREVPETLVLQLTAENVGGPVIPIGGEYTLQK